MNELTIKNEGGPVKSSHVAVNGSELVAHITGSQSGSFKLDSRMYTVAFDSGEAIEFRQRGGFTIDHVTYEIYQDEKNVGEVKRGLLKGANEVTLYEVEIAEQSPFAIKEGWLSTGVTTYTNNSGNAITIEKGRTGLFDWTVRSESEIPQLDIAIMLFMKAISGLMIH